MSICARRETGLCVWLSGWSEMLGREWGACRLMIELFQIHILSF